MRREAPEPWAAAMLAVGAKAPSGAPSITKLAGLAGVSVESARRMVYGMGTPDPSTVTAIANALRTDVTIVSEWAQQRRSESEPFALPADADLLTGPERKAITALVRAITAPRKEARDAQIKEPKPSEGSPEAGRPAGPGSGRRTSIVKPLGKRKRPETPRPPGLPEGVPWAAYAEPNEGALLREERDRQQEQDAVDEPGPEEGA